MAVIVAAFTLLAAMAAGGLAAPKPASADEIGMAPTAANITGNGSFTVTSATITNASGFRGGTVYYPTAEGSYPLVAIVPGFTDTWASMQWIGPRLASWGFVVVGVSTNSNLDFPSARATQQLAALTWAVNTAPTAVRSRADGTRRGVAGYSMGGGGSVEALADDTTGVVKAGVALTPWHTDTTWPAVTDFNRAW